MTTEEVIKNLLERAYELKREHESGFKLQGFSFTRANLEMLIAWLEEGCPFPLPQEERTLLAILAE